MFHSVPSQAKTAVPILRDGGGRLPKYRQKPLLNPSATVRFCTRYRLSHAGVRLTPGSNGGPMEPGVFSVAAWLAEFVLEARTQLPSPCHAFYVRGTVSSLHFWGRSFFLQAPNGALRVPALEQPFALKRSTFCRLDGRTRPNPVGPAGPPGQSAALTAILRALATAALGTQIPSRPSRIFASVFVPSTESGRKKRRLKEP